MSNQKVKRLIIGRSGRRYLLHVEEMKYKHLQNVAAHNNKSLNRQINELIDWLPTPAAVYDRTKKLVAHNQLYLDAFFRDCPSIVRPGTPLEFMARAWANRRGLGPEEAEEFVQARLEFHTARRSSVQLTAGGTCLHLAETQHEDYRVVLFTEVTAFAETS